MKIIPIQPQSVACDRPGRVMVVDDHRQARESMAHALRRPGTRCFVVPAPVRPSRSWNASRSIAS